MSVKPLLIVVPGIICHKMLSRQGFSTLSTLEGHKAGCYCAPVNFLVTGGAGFLGSHLCDRLLETGAEVICLDNFFTGSKSNVYSLAMDGLMLSLDDGKVACWWWRSRKGFVVMPSNDSSGGFRRQAMAPMSSPSRAIAQIQAMHRAR